jgi:hypothetical protein
MSGKKSEADRRGMLVGGLITLGVGVIFLLSNMRILPDIGEMWPLIPIVVGVALVIGSFRKSAGSNTPGRSSGTSGTG